MKSNLLGTLLGGLALIWSSPAMSDQGHSALQTDGSTSPDTYTPSSSQQMLLEPMLNDPDFGFDLSIDALFWQQMSSQMVFASKGSTSSVSVAAGSGTWQYPVYNIDWGFRLGLGLYFPDGCWEVDALYTRINFRGTMSTATGAGETISDFLTAHNVPVQPTSIHNHSTFHYDNLDIVMKRAYKLAKFLSVEPLFGFEAQWLRSVQTNKDSGGNLPALFGESEYKIYLKNRQWSIGPIAGVHTIWDLFWGFNIIGNVDIALTTGVNKIHDTESTSINPTVIQLDSRSHHNQLHTQSFFGVGWNTTVNESITIGAKAGWELLILTNAIFGPTTADLQAQGGTAGLSVLF